MSTSNNKQNNPKAERPTTLSPKRTIPYKCACANKDELHLHTPPSAVTAGPSSAKTADQHFELVQQAWAMIADSIPIIERENDDPVIFGKELGYIMNSHGYCAKEIRVMPLSLYHDQILLDCLHQSEVAALHRSFTYLSCVNLTPIKRGAVTIFLTAYQCFVRISKKDLPALRKFMVWSNLMFDKNFAPGQEQEHRLAVCYFSEQYEQGKNAAENLLDLWAFDAYSNSVVQTKKIRRARRRLPIAQTESEPFRDRDFFDARKWLECERTGATLPLHTPLMMINETMQRERIRFTEETCSVGTKTDPWFTSTFEYRNHANSCGAKNKMLARQLAAAGFILGFEFFPATLPIVSPPNACTCNALATSYGVYHREECAMEDVTFDPTCGATATPSAPPAPSSSGAPRAAELVDQLLLGALGEGKFTTLCFPPKVDDQRPSLHSVIVNTFANNPITFNGAVSYLESMANQLKTHGYQTMVKRSVNSSGVHATMIQIGPHTFVEEGSLFTTDLAAFHFAITSMLSLPTGQGFASMFGTFTNKVKNVWTGMKTLEKIGGFMRKAKEFLDTDNFRLGGLIIALCSNLYVLAQTSFSPDTVLASTIGFIAGFCTRIEDVESLAQKITQGITQIWISLAPKAQSGTTEVGTPAISGIVSIVSSLFGVICNSTMSLKKILSISSALNSLSRGLAGAESLFEKIPAYIEGAYYRCYEYFMGSLPLDESNGDCIKRWCTEISELLGQKTSITLHTTEGAALIKKIEGLYNDGLRYTAFLGKAGVSNVLFQHHMSAIRDMYRDAMALGAAPSNFRTEPFNMILNGQSGCGKSTAVPFIVADMLRGKTTDIANNIYTRKVDQDFWDGYKNQLAVIYDDFGQRRDTEGTPNPEYMEMIMAGNIAPYPLHMAELSGKGNVNFTSKLVILTTNDAHKPNNIKSLTCVDAFYRRFHLRAEVKRDLTVPAPTNGGVNLDAYKFDVLYYDQATEPQILARDLSYDEFLSYAKSEMDKHEHKSEAIVNSIGNYAAVDKKFPPPPVVSAPRRTTHVMPVAQTRTPSSIEEPEIQEDTDFKDCEDETEGETMKNFLGFNITLADLSDANKQAVIAVALEKGTRVTDVDSKENITALFRASPLSFVNTLIQLDIEVVPSVHRIKKEKELEKLCECMDTKLKKQASWLRPLGILVAFAGIILVTYKTRISQMIKTVHHEFTSCAVGNAFRVLKSATSTPTSVAFMPLLGARPCWTRCDLCAHMKTLGSVTFDAMDHSSMMEAGLKIYNHLDAFSVKREKFELACAEANISGDSFTGAKRRAQVETTTDSAAFEISQKVGGNMCRIVFAAKDGSTMATTASCLGGNDYLMVRHFTGQVDWTQKVKIVSVNATEALEVDGHTCVLKTVCDAHGKELDATIMRVKLAHARPTIIKHFIRREDLGRFVSGRGTLIGVSSSGNKFFPKVTIVPKFEADDTVTDYGITSGEKPEIWTSRFQYLHSAETVNGDCGGLLTLCNTAITGKILGIHAFAWEDARGAAIRVCREDIEETLMKFRPIGQTYPPPMANETEFLEPMDIVPGTPKTSIPTGAFVSYGKAKDVYTGNGKSHIHPSLIHGKVVEPTQRPARLKPFFRDDDYIDPIQLALKKAGPQPVKIDTELLKECVEAYLPLLQKNLIRENQRVHTLEEAVEGVEGDPYIGPINRKSSSGYHFSKQPGVGSGKSYYLGKTDYRISTVLRNCVQQKTDELKQGIVRRTVWVDTLKDERRDHERVEAGKTRAFSAAAIDYTLTFRQYYLAAAKHIMSNRITNEIAVGINVFSSEWSRLAYALQSRGHAVFAGDFSNFDGTLASEILWAVHEALESLYPDATDEDRRVRTGLWWDIVNSVHVVGDHLYGWTHSQPSGNALTAIINSIYNSISMRYVFSLVTGLSPMDFDKHATMISYGDDNVINVSWDIRDVFNQHTATAGYAEIGMTYTDEHKGTQGPALREIQDVTFLKRSFKYEQAGYFGCPRDLESVLETVNWVRGPFDHALLTQENIETVMTELAYHGEHLYNTYRQLFLDAALTYLPGNIPCIPLYARAQRLIIDGLSTH